MHGTNGVLQHSCRMVEELDRFVIDEIGQHKMPTHLHGDISAVWHVRHATTDFAIGSPPSADHRATAASPARHP